MDSPGPATVLPSRASVTIPSARGPPTSRLAGAAYPLPPYPSLPDQGTPAKQAQDGLPMREVEMLTGTPQQPGHLGGKRPAKLRPGSDSDDETHEEDGSVHSAEGEESDEEAPLVQRRMPPLKHEWNL